MPLVLHFERDRPRILVVDDDPMVLDIVTTRLSLAGCTTYSARDGLTAVERIREVRPVAMVLDINMPGLDGFGVLKHMKIAGSIRSIATLVLTARNRRRETGHCAWRTRLPGEALQGRSASRADDTLAPQARPQDDCPFCAFGQGTDHSSSGNLAARPHADTCEGLGELKRYLVSGPIYTHGRTDVEFDIIRSAAPR